MHMDITPVSDNVVRVTLTGRLDTSGVDRVETTFTAALVPSANNAVVDLSRVDLVTSMGIRMLISAAKSLKSRRATLALFGVQAHVNQVFEAVALHKILPICSTEAEALAAIAAVTD
jgi:anti-anti-sigma factor